MIQKLLKYFIIQKMIHNGFRRILVDMLLIDLIHML